MGLWKNIFISNNTLPHVPPGYIYTVDMFKLYFDPHKTDGGMIPFCQGMKKLMYVKLLIMEYSACCLRRMCNWHALLRILGNRLLFCKFWFESLTIDVAL